MEMEQIGVWSLVIAAAATMFLLSSYKNIVIHYIVRDTRSSSNNNINNKCSSMIPLGDDVGIWPFLGETLQFISCACSDQPESFMNKRRRLYGKVFKSHLFGRRTIVSTDAEVSKMIMQSDERTFVASYPKSVSELMGKSSILLVNGSLHRRMHASIASFFKSSSLKSRIASDTEKFVLESMLKWDQNSLVYIQDQAKDIAFKVMVKALISVEGRSEEMHVLKKHFQEFIAGLMSFPFNFPGTQLYRSLQAKKKMIKLIHEIVRRKRKKMRNGEEEEKDVADVLVKDEELMTDEMISENMIDLMIPGHDSVPVLITLAIKFLSDSPPALHQLVEENLKLKRLKEKQGQAYSWNDYLSLPFTRNVITETLRLGNIIIGVMREAVRDVEIKGHLIPKGWSVLAYFRSVHLDNDLYDLPHHFNPWRWPNAATDHAGFCSNFTPFGGGNRLCPGLDLARLEASIFLHHFVTRFRWKAKEDSIVNFPTVRLKKRMPVWVKTRSDFP